MFKNFEEFLAGNATLEWDVSGEATSKEVQIAVAALLSHFALADDHMRSEETEKISSALRREFNLADHEVGELLEVVQVMRNDRVKLDRFVELVNLHFNVDQKTTLMGIAWQVVLSDNQVEKFEAQSAARIRAALGLTMEQGVRARKVAEARLKTLTPPKSAEPEE
jgi:uncharacterized tellurite resistance protein B-like protein